MDLRKFLKKLEQNGELFRFKNEVLGEEIFSIQWKVFEKKGPALLFENVKGQKIPILTNVFGTLDRWAMAAGFPRDKTPKEYRNLYVEKIRNRGMWLKPQKVDTGPCKEIILRGDQANFSELPIFKWHPLDAGRYITLPASITRDAKFGTNVGIYRMMLHDDKTSGIMCNIFQHQGIFLSRAIKQGKDKIDCAIALGADPSIYVAAATSLDLGSNELELAGALQGKPIEVVKAETCDLEVPANAEIILEGEISTSERKQEAPFAEYDGYFEEPMVLPVFKLECITMRKDCIYQNTTADKEGEVLRVTPLRAKFFENCQNRLTGFVDCWLPESGRGYMAIVSIKKYYPGWGKQAIYQVLGLPFSGAMLNCIVVVDDDMDPADPDQWIWALSTRVDPFYDVITTKPMAVYPLNPSASERLDVHKPTGSHEFLVCSKMGIDATLKTGVERPNRGETVPVKLPEEMASTIEERLSELGLE